MADSTDIVKYTKEDFLNTATPYEEVYKHHQDGFRMAQELEKMAQLAKDEGVTNFKTQFKEYVKTLKKVSGGISSDNVSGFEGQDLELNTGEWVADDSGVYKETKFGEIVACVHPVLPVQRMVNVDTGIEKLKIAFRKGGYWKSIVSDRKDLATANSITGLSNYGVAVTSENARDLVQYIHDVENLNYEKIPEVKSISRLGWIDDIGFSPYVDGLEFDGEEAFNQMFNAVTEKGDFEKWKKLCKKIRASDNIPARIALAASFASVLVKPLGALPFFVHFWGGSGTGKTVALMLAASVWANPAMGEYIYTFDSTSTSQGIRAGFVNSLPLIIDELQIMAHKKEFDAMIYRLAQGVGRSRANRGGGLQKTQSWRNCIMTTGEQSITTNSSGGGAVNRVVEINCEDNKLFDDPHEVLKVIRSNYGHAGRIFLEKLESEIEMEDLKELYRKTTESVAEHTTAKQAGSAADILVADILLDMFIFEDGKALKERDVIQYLAEESDANVNMRALDWLTGWIVQNHVKFSGTFDAETYNLNEIYGKQDDFTVTIISSVFNKACDDAGFNSKSFKDWLRRNEVIDATDNRFTKTVRLGAITPKCVILNKNKAEELLKV